MHQQKTKNKEYTLVGEFMKGPVNIIGLYMRDPVTNKTLRVAGLQKKSAMKDMKNRPILLVWLPEAVQFYFVFRL